MMFGRFLVGDPVEWLLASPIFLLLLLLLLTWKAFRSGPVSSLRPWRWWLLLVLGWAWLSSTPALANRLLLGLERQYAPPVLPAGPVNPSLVVVLASGEPFDPGLPDPWQLDLASLRRTRAAVDFWRQHGGRLIFVGSSYGHESMSVADRMARLAVTEGVPHASVQALTGSINTYQNFRDLAHDDTRVGDGRFFLVTSAAHMPRAMAVAHARGLAPIPVPCDFRAMSDMRWQAWVPNNNAFPVFSLALHEIVGRWYYELRGRV